MRFETPPGRQLQIGSWCAGGGVQADCCIELDTNRYSVPWRLIGESVQVAVAGGHVNIRHVRAVKSSGSFDEMVSDQGASGA